MSNEPPYGGTWGLRQAADCEFVAEHHHRAAQTAHDDVGLAAFAVPALHDRCGGLVRVGEEPEGFEALAVQLELVLA